MPGSQKAKRLVEVVPTDPLPAGGKEEKDLEGPELNQKRMSRESSDTKAAAGQIVNGAAVIAHSDVIPAANCTQSPLPACPGDLFLVGTVLQLFGF